MQLFEIFEILLYLMDQILIIQKVISGCLWCSEMYSLFYSASFCHDCAWGKVFLGQCASHVLLFWVWPLHKNHPTAQIYFWGGLHLKLSLLLHSLGLFKINCFPIWKVDKIRQLQQAKWQKSVVGQPLSASQHADHESDESQTCLLACPPQANSIKKSDFWIITKQKRKQTTH